jgi:hypothetical protein
MNQPQMNTNKHRLFEGAESFKCCIAASALRANVLTIEQFSDVFLSMSIYIHA